MNAPSFSIISPQLNELSWTRDHLILYLLKGTAHLRINTNEYTLTAEDFIVIEPGSLYSFSYGRDLNLLQLTMSDELLRQLTRAPIRRVIHCFSGDHQGALLGAHSEVRRRLANLFDLQYGSVVPNELLFTGRAILLFEYLYANFSDLSAAVSGSELEPNAYGYVRAAYAYVQKHACSAARLTDAAAYIGVTPEYLSRCLRQYMDISFTDLIQQERLRIGLQLLRDGNHSITEIAYETGYSAPSAFITAFKKRFGITPKYYRTHLMETVPRESLRINDIALYDSIRKYIRHDSTEDITSGDLRSIQRKLHVDARKAYSPFRDGWNNVMAVCSASDILKSTIQQQIRSAKQDLGFRYLYFHDVFSDEMMIYEEDEYGNPMYNFRNLDNCLSHILSLGLKPYIELSFVPLKLTSYGHEGVRYLNKMNVSPPADWNKWNALIQETVNFCVRQYGAEEVSGWRFTSTMLYNVHLHRLITYEEYLRMYKQTYFSVKKACPRATVLGPGADVTLIAEEWDTAFQPFLDFCALNNCMPDMISLRLYPFDMRQFSRKDVTNLRESRARIKPCPNFFTKEDYAHKCLVQAVKNLSLAGYGPERISIDRWNSSVSQTDPSNDICYKSAYIVKTVLESRNLVSNLTYWSLSDNMVHLDFSFAGTELAGSLGLITYNGMHKSAYYAMRLLRMLKGSVLAEGDGYIILKDDSDFLIMLYQYCHYDKTSIKRMIANQIVSDPYTMCVSGERQVVSIEISNADIRSYSMESFSIGRRSGGNLYENWHRFGNPRRVNELQRNYLECISQPAYHITEFIPDNGVLNLSCVIEPHDVMLIRLRPV